MIKNGSDMFLVAGGLDQLMITVHGAIARYSVTSKNIFKMVSIS
jgi:hypothetical protein